MAVNHITDASFKEEVLDYNGIVLVDMWAEWCQPCRMLGPVIEEIAEDMGDKVKVCKLNVDEHPQTAGQYQVTGIPTVMVFKNGELVDRIVGLRPKSFFVDSINGLVD
jgi:thioredoxin 1